MDRLEACARSPVFLEHLSHFYVVTRELCLIDETTGVAMNLERWVADLFRTEQAFPALVV